MGKLLFVVIFMAFAVNLFAEEVTITTYYPAPEGVYKDLWAEYYSGYPETQVPGEPIDTFFGLDPNEQSYLNNLDISGTLSVDYLAATAYYDTDDPSFTPGSPPTGDYFIDPYPATADEPSIIVDGAVAIGTTDPGTAKLAVLDGNVGVGTTSPQAKLQVEGAPGFGGNDRGLLFLNNTQIGATATIVTDISDPNSPIVWQMFHQDQARNLWQIEREAENNGGDFGIVRKRGGAWQTDDLHIDFDTGNIGINTAPTEYTKLLVYKEDNPTYTEFISIRGTTESNTSWNGIGVQGEGNIGVKGVVLNDSFPATTKAGVFGTLQAGAIRGRGVEGFVEAGPLGQNLSMEAVYGSVANNGPIRAVGALGYTYNAGGGTGPSGFYAVYGNCTYAPLSNFAGYFVGNVNITGNLYHNGISHPGWDIAEYIKGDDSNIEPGDVVSINPTLQRTVTKSAQAYDTTVSGVISTSPGDLGGFLKHDDGTLYTREEMEKESYRPLVLVGQVPCKVTTENGPIKPGDLLVTSSKPGYAMKADRSRLSFGMVIGKALEPLEKGEDKIMVLVNLQ